MDSANQHAAVVPSVLPGNVLPVVTRTPLAGLALGRILAAMIGIAIRENARIVR